MLVTMAAVHEDMHQGAGQQEQVGQNAQQVGGVLGGQEEAADRKGYQQRQTSR